MRTTKKVIASVLAACMLASTSVVAGFAATTEESVGANNYVVAVEEIDAEYTYNGGDLGATYSPESTTFKVWSPTATKVVLNRYATGSDSEPGKADLGTVEMEKLMDGDKWTGVWTTTVEGDIVNTYYTYTITSAHPYSGELQTAETQDVYSVATGVNGTRSMVCDLSKTNPDGWENDAHVVLDKSTQSTVWELHVKDFSWDEASGVSEANRGKYLAFTETGTTLNNEGELSTCIDYLKQLGITTVQLNPFYDFHTIDESGSNDQFNWGYDPQNYNVPEGSYSTNPYDGNVRIKECKQMIQALHNAGISVVMDVVYNHTFSCDASDSCFQASVPDYYYRLRSNGQFSNGSGCGNEVASERAMARDYVVQSCLYWVNEYHVDGFRFDLMGLIDVETMNIIREELDKVDSRLTMWGEGWQGGTSYHASKTCTGEKYVAALQANASKTNERVAFFNDSIRNGVKGSVFDIAERGFIAGNTAYAPAIRHGARANTDETFGWLSSAPSQTVSYAACHDNATIYDQITASAGLGKFGVRYDDGVKMNKLASAIVYTSQGVSFVLAGEEMGRTKYGDTNSYKSAANINQLSWNNIVEYADVVSYYKGMMKIKAAFSPFTAMDKAYQDAYNFNDDYTDDVKAAAAEKGQTLKPLNAESNTVAYTVANDQAGEWNKIAVMFNGGSSAVSITLQDTSVTDWVIIANDQTAGVESLGEVKGSTFELPAYSALIAVDKQGFDEAAIESDLGKVVVNYKYKSAAGKDLASPITLQGNIGDSYLLSTKTAVPEAYEIVKIEGELKGVYTQEPQTVTFVYSDYVPESIRNYGDADGDGDVTINDVTYIQKILVDMVKIDADRKAQLDYDYDGELSVSDATMLQKYLLDVPVSSGTVNVNYFYVDSKGKEKKLTDSVEITGRVGSDFTTVGYKLTGYVLDPERLPIMTEGKIPFGPVLTIDYYYVVGNPEVKIHVKHNGSLTWDPVFWIWGSTLAGSDKGNFTGGAWPGKAASLNAETGWYDYSFSYDGVGTYNVIVSNNAATQTMDYKGFVENEMWIVIDDETLTSGSNNFLTFYTENPDTNPNAPIAQTYIEQ